MISLGVTADSVHRVLRTAEGRGPRRTEPTGGRAAGVQARVQDDRRRRHRDGARRHHPVPHGGELRARVRAHAGGGDGARPVRGLVLQAPDRVPDRAQRPARAAARLRPHQRHRRGGGAWRASCRYRWPGGPDEPAPRRRHLPRAHHPALPHRRAPPDLVRAVRHRPGPVARRHHPAPVQPLDRLRGRAGDHLLVRPPRDGGGRAGRPAGRRGRERGGADRQRHQRLDPRGVADRRTPPRRTSCSTTSRPRPVSTEPTSPARTWVPRGDRRSRARR